MDGFLLIDKSEGSTSFYCVKVLRKVLDMRRIGFVGTLDPLATGLMILAIGEATKLIPYLEKTDKIYEVVIALGAVSNTYDANGVIKEVLDAKKPALDLIREVLKQEFSGACEQQPPIYSAIWIEGKRAYDLARKGQEVVLKKRTVHFHKIEVLSYEWPLLSLRVHCGSGTYIRSLAYDLGQKLECGGYVKALRRTVIGIHKVVNAIDLNKINSANVDEFLVKPEVFFKDWEQLVLSDSEFRILANGSYINDASGSKKAPIMAIYNDKCVGILETVGTKNGTKLKFLKKFNIV
jgi:tRNA pseudouridine55 synthase